MIHMVKVGKVVPEPRKLLPDKNSKGPLPKGPKHIVPEVKETKLLPEKRKGRGLVPG